MYEVATSATRERITPRRASSLARQVGLCRLSEPPYPAPEVDLPGCASQDLSAVEGIFAGCGDNVVFGGTLSGVHGAVIHLRKKICTGGHEQARCLFHVGSRNLHAFAVGQRLGDELVEHRVIELFPPFGIGSLSHLLRLVPESLRGIDLGTFVVRARSCSLQNR